MKTRSQATKKRTRKGAAVKSCRKNRRRNNQRSLAVGTATVAAAAAATLTTAASHVPPATPLRSATSSPYFATPTTARLPRSVVAAAAASARTATTNPAGKDKHAAAISSLSPSSTKTNTKRTQSFGALTAAQFPDLAANAPPVHTLILGTHPSVVSLACNQYYGHPMNAFWWIAGDCLGFRRGTAISPKTNKPYQFASNLQFGEDKILTYQEQNKFLVSHGFAMWDVLQSCNREGSLDANIKKETPNDIRGFCRAHHPHLKRIVFSNGVTGCKFFVKHFRDWWESGELRPGDNDASQKAFGKFAKKTNNFSNATITCVSALGVSPAAALYSYIEKREDWRANVYGPGLELFSDYVGRQVARATAIDAGDDDDDDDDKKQPGSPTSVAQF